jgi:hypothetical protein
VVNRTLAHSRLLSHPWYLPAGRGGGRGADHDDDNDNDNDNDDDGDT